MAKRNADMDRAGKNRFCPFVTVKNLIVCALILFAKLQCIIFGTVPSNKIFYTFFIPIILRILLIASPSIGFSLLLF